VTASKKRVPLAYALAPTGLDSYVGQAHLVGENGVLRHLIEKEQLPSIIFFGPPGCGKTSLAKIIASTTSSRYIPLNATTAKVADIKLISEEAKRFQEKTLVFIDEIHRFSKTQQDALLPDVENGTLTLIGATTENPFFAVNPSLLSRCQLFELYPLSEEELLTVLDHTLSFLTSGLTFSEEVRHFVCSLSAGDARKLIGLIELAHSSYPEGHTLTIDDIQRLGQGQGLALSEDNHYDMASAFIKSLRGSDADAALYWLARLLVGGEDPKFIARRLVIFASEDIGNADPQALVIATALIQAVQFIGMPEIRINLAQVVTYLATAPKSNASYTAIEAAFSYVQNNTLHRVPMHLKSSNYAGAKKLGHGKGYLYPHDYPYGIVAQSYMPDTPIFYKPKDLGFEKTIQQRLVFIKERKNGKSST
jgi:putative ATPase